MAGPLFFLDEEQRVTDRAVDLKTNGVLGVRFEHCTHNAMRHTSRVGPDQQSDIDEVSGVTDIVATPETFREGSDGLVEKDKVLRGGPDPGPCRGDSDRDGALSTDMILSITRHAVGRDATGPNNLSCSASVAGKLAKRVLRRITRSDARSPKRREPCSSSEVSRARRLRMLRKSSGSTEPLHYYFKDKQEILDEVVREAAEADVAFAEEVAARDIPPFDKLRMLIIGLMASYAAHYPMLYVYVRENLANVSGERSQWSAHMRSVNRRYDNAIIGIVQEGIDNGTIRPLTSARVIAFGIIGMVGWTNRWYVPDRSPESAETIGKAYAEMVLQGLSA